MDWQTDRLRSFTEQVALYGTTLQHNGLTAVCLATPFQISRSMAMAGDYPEISTVFTLARTEYDRVAVGLHDKIISDGKTFQVQMIMDDSAEPTVDLQCNVLV